jgi:Ca2+-binding RTX toxin-like protein
MVPVPAATVVPASRAKRAGVPALAFTIAAGLAAFGPAVPAQAATATCHGVKATIVGTPSSDVLRGTPGRDVINGLGGDDTLYGSGGNDLVCGGPGADQLYGGAGRDRLYGGLDRLRGDKEDGPIRVGDTLRGGPGSDHLDGGTDRRPAEIVVNDIYSWDRSGRGVRIDLRQGVARGEGRDTLAGRTYSVVGSAFADVVHGTNRRDRISTGAGRDVVYARGGDDFVDVDDPHRFPGGEADRAWGGRGDDQLSARGGQDRLSGGSGNDEISASGNGNDVLIGGPGRDSLYAQLGNTDGPQTFNGGGGLDFLQMESSMVRRKGATSTGTWDMATGAMTVTFDREIQLSVPHIDQAYLETPRTAWSITGTTGDDQVFGDTVSNLSSVSFDALDGDDVFEGTGGDDLFNGGPGNDHSWGMYNGDDTCISVETIDGDDCEHVS